MCLLADTVCLLADTVSKPSLDTLRNQMDEVQMTMSANISQVMDRGEKLDDLELKADQLEMQAGMFMKASTESLDETMDEMYNDEIIFNEPTILSLFGDTSCLLSDDLYEYCDITISVRDKIDMIVCT